MGTANAAKENLKKVKKRGRKKGSKNKATVELKEATQLHAQAAIDALVHLVDKGEPDTARISAAKELLDRGYGKSPQQTVLDVNVTNPPELIIKFTRSNDAGSKSA